MQKYLQVDEETKRVLEFLYIAGAELMKEDLSYYADAVYKLCLASGLLRVDSSENIYCVSSNRRPRCWKRILVAIPDIVEKRQGTSEKEMSDLIKKSKAKRRAYFNHTFSEEAMSLIYMSYQGLRADLSKSIGKGSFGLFYYLTSTRWIHLGFLKSADVEGEIFIDVTDYVKGETDAVRQAIAILLGRPGVICDPLTLNWGLPADCDLD